MAQGLAVSALGQVFDQAVAETIGLSSASSSQPAGDRAGAPGGLLVTNVLPDGRTGIVVPGGSSRRPLGPRAAAFEFKDGERVLLIGDSLVEGEAKYGYLETRMTAQYPERSVRFRVLTDAAENPLTHPAGTVAKDKPADKWLEQLLSPVAAFKPTVVLVGYGMAASFDGEAGLPNFKTNYHRLLDALKSLDTNIAVRFILMSPVHHEILLEEPGPAAHNAQLEACATAIRETAEQRGGDFADFFGWSRADAHNVKARAQQRNLRIPPFTERGTNLAAYGYLRVSLELERALRWMSGTWRFGLQRNDSLREGGFGARILQHERSERHARVALLAERLPTPNAPGYLDLEAGSRPQCYVQIPGLEPGRYTLKVDGKPVLTGTHLEWGRFEIISEGPPWDQAEELRKTIVNKNELVAQSWRLAKASAPSEKAKVGGLEGQITELEAKIATLRRPVKHTLELVQDEKLPAPPNQEELVRPIQPPTPAVPPTPAAPPKPKPDASLPPPPSPPGMDTKPGSPPPQ
jgi:lysophospholipase L1-like esterase